MQSVPEMLEEILKKEGGFTDNPKDTAHQKRVAEGDKWDSYCTNMGITQFTLSDYLGRQASVSEVRNLTRDLAKLIYRTNYFDKPKISQLNPAIVHKVFDMSVNFGPGRAIRILQEALNDLGFQCDVDGKLGPQTWRLSNLAVSTKTAKVVMDAIIAERIKTYEGIVASNPSQAIFMNGWRRRSESFRIQ